MSHMYLLKRGKTYYFNRRVRTKMLRLSLGLSNKPEANIIAARLFVFTNSCIRRGMNYEQIKSLAKEEAQRLHDEWLERHFMGEPLSEATIDHESEVQIDFQKMLYEGLVAPDQIQDALAQVLYVSLREKTMGEWQRPDRILTALDNSKAFVSSLPPEGLKPVSTFIDDYIQSRDESGRATTEETKSKKRFEIAEFVKLIGDLPLSEIGIKQAEEFRRLLRKLPPNRENRKDFKEMSVKEILALDLPKDQCLSDTHVRRTLIGLNSYFTWLCNRKFISLNPFSDVTVSAETNSYVRFSVTDLSVLFKDGVYSLGDSNSTASRWWLMLLALYSGARLSELCQLLISDVQCIDGVLCLVITDEDESQKVKTKAAKRYVPVHTDLLSLGFEDYVKQVQASDRQRLLPTVWTGSSKAGKAASTWFARYRTKHFPQLEGENKVFHSFRHTLIQTAMKAGVDMSKLQQMVGHEPSLLGSTKTYIGDGFPVTMLAEELAKVSFPDIDLEWLLANNWRGIKKP
jgi:integrase